MSTREEYITFVDKVKRMSKKIRRKSKLTFTLISNVSPRMLWRCAEYPDIEYRVFKEGSQWYRYYYVNNVNELFETKEQAYTALLDTLYGKH